MISSYCGIDCGICDLYVNEKCTGCFKSEDKRGKCRVPECATERNVENCLKCIRVDYCKKRRNAIGECLVFLPRKDISPRRPYLIDAADRDEAFNMFFRYVYDGADGLVVHFDSIKENWDYMLQDVKSIGGVYDLKEIQKTVSSFLEENYNPIILIDKLKALKEKNHLPKVLEFLNEINKKATSKSGIVLIINDLEGRDRDHVTNYMANMLVDSMLKAVSNPQRKVILKLLGKRGKSSFKELIDELDYYNPSKLSFHLKLLRDTGILDQDDDDGIYYISPVGRDFDRLIDQMSEVSASKVQFHPTAETKLEPVSDNGAEGYNRYIRAAKKSGNFKFINVVKDIKKSLGTYYGEKQTKDVLLTALGDYIKSEKAIDKKGLKGLVSEIVFVHLVSTMDMKNAIKWADEIIEEHDLG